MSTHSYARRPAIVAVCATSLVPLLAVPAFAHTKLLRSSPAKGAQVAAPTEVRLVFSESPRPALVKIRVRDAAGREHAGPIRVRGATVAARPAGTLAPGRSTVAYRVVSADGHPVAGDVPFTVTRTAPGSAAPRTSVTAQSTAASPDAGRDHNGGARRAWIGAGLVAVLALGTTVLVRARHRTRDHA